MKITQRDLKSNNLSLDEAINVAQNRPLWRLIRGQPNFGFGFGFRPKAPLYFRWRTRFQPNVIRHFRPTFGYGRKWNFHFQSTSKIDVCVWRYAPLAVHATQVEGLYST